MAPARPPLPENPPQSPRQIVAWIEELIRDRLPRGWTLDTAFEAPREGWGRADAILSIEGPDGREAKILVETKGSVEGRDVPMLEPGSMIAARYLSPPVRERLASEGLNYADATGNLLVFLQSPALYLRDVGADRDPWRGPGRPRDSFRGSIAARAVRALADFSPPMSVPELVKRSGVSTGAAYRVVDFLERQGLLERGKRGPITDVRWRPMLERWARDYDLDLARGATPMLAPRGMKSVLNGLGGLEFRDFVVTGSMAASFFEEYAKVRLAMIYVDRPAFLIDRLELRPVESGANVLLISPPDAVVYARSEEISGVPVAAPSQIVVDLLNGPGRAPAEAEALLDWMERNEAAWRR